MSYVLEEHEGRGEFPFPPMASVHSASSSNSLPSAHGSLPSRHGSLARSHGSSSSSPLSTPSPRPSRRRGDRERRDDLVGSSTTKQLLSRLLAQEEHEAQSTRSVVVALSERLERETRRADEAERRVVDVLHRLRTAHEATLLAQADTARAREELRLHAMRLEEAQGEIRRAQDIVDALERQRNEAEEEAARARTSVRKYRERELVARAREQGRREGYQEGFARGQDMGYYEAAAAGGEQGVYAEQAMGDTYSEDGPEEIHINYDRGAASQPVWRPPSRSSTSGISRRSPPTITIQVPSPPSRPSTTRADRTTATHDPDLAIHAATLPVPTLTSPLRMPSPSHAQPPSPTPALVPTSSNRHSRDSDDLHPIAIHRATPEPVHPPYQIPPDNWIPLEGSPIPPQHEFAELHSPRSRSPSLTDMAPQPVQSYEPSVRSRDYAYAQGAVPIPPPGNNNLLFSPSSRTSTRISEYELLRDRRDTGPRPPRTPGMPEDLRQVFRSPGPSSERPRTPVRQDLRPPSPRGPRTQESPAPLPVPAPFAGGADDYGRGRQRRPHHTRAEGSSLERMFKKRFHERERNSGSSGGVPDIYVESPSSGEHTPETAHPVTEPHMLSPDSTPAPLPVLPPEDPIPIRIEGPDEVPDDTRPLPPLPAGETDYRDAVMVPAPGEQYPVGFVPLQFTPNAEPPTPLSPKDTTTTIPHISHEPAGSPRYTPRYAEAPMPAGLVYPDPLGKSPASGAANAVPLPSSPKSSTSSRRRRGSVAARALSPLQLQLFSSLRSNDSIASLTEQNIGRRIT